MQKKNSKKMYFFSSNSMDHQTISYIWSFVCLLNNLDPDPISQKAGSGFKNN